MPAAPGKPERVQLYLRSDQIDRLHKLKGAKRGTTISGLAMAAVDLLFLEQDRNSRKKPGKRDAMSV